MRDPRDALVDIHNNNLMSEDPWLYTPLMTHGGLAFKQVLERCGTPIGLNWEMGRISHPWVRALGRV